MRYMKDVKNRFGEPDGKLKTFEFSDLELAGQTLRVLRGRMLGMTWRELGDREGCASTTLFDRSNMFFGDLITRYDFKKADGLPEKYCGVYGAKSGSSLAGVIEAREAGLYVPYTIYMEYEDELLFYEYIRNWNAVMPVTWGQYVAMKSEERYRYADMTETKRALNLKRFVDRGIDVTHLNDDLNLRGNDHLHGEHGCLEKRVDAVWGTYSKGRYDLRRFY